MAILFAARRLGPDAVAFLLAGRAGSVPSGLVHDVPVLRGRRAPCGRRRGPAPATPPRPAVLDRLVAETSGNPLALLEVSQRLDAAQLLGTAPLPDPLPAGEWLRRCARGGGGRAVARSRACRAAAGAGGHVVGDRDRRRRQRLAGPDEAARRLDEARERGVLVQRGRARYAFRHPLLRSTVLELATPAEQREPRTRPSPTRCPPATGPGSGTAPSPRSAPTTGWPTSWRGWRRRTGTGSGYAAAVRGAGARRDAHRRPRPGGPAAGRWPPTTPSWPVTSPASARLVDRVLAEDAPDRARGEALFTLGMLEQYAGSVPRSVEHLDDASDLLDGPLLRPGADRAGGGPLPPQRRRRDGGLRPPDRRGRRPRRTPSSSCSPPSPAASPSS